MHHAGPFLFLLWLLQFPRDRSQSSKVFFVVQQSRGLFIELVNFLDNAVESFKAGERDWFRHVFILSRRSRPRKICFPPVFLSIYTGHRILWHRFLRTRFCLTEHEKPHQRAALSDAFRSM
jgi:hypothetical protein